MVDQEMPPKMERVSTVATPSNRDRLQAIEAKLDRVDVLLEQLLEAEIDVIRSQSAIMRALQTLNNSNNNHPSIPL